MVEFIEDTSKQRCVIKTEKMKTDIVVYKEIGGYHFFKIKMETGKTPDELSGKYSSLRKGMLAVENYLKNKKETKTVRRDNFSKAREERKKQDGAKTKSKGSKHVHQGSSN
jgi:hypothetical protein